MGKRYGSYTEDEKARKMNIHARTSSWTKTLYDPYVNILRASSEAFSAAIGQADSIQVSPFDESFQKPTSFSRRIARNTQVILQEEAHIGKTADAAGGSYYIETMTNELAEKAWKLFQEIERKGGMTKAIENGAVQKRVEDISSRKEIDINHRKKVFVGTNQYPDIEENPVSVIPEDDSQEIEEFVQKTTSKKRTEDIEERETRASIVYEGIERAKKGWTLGQIATWCGKQVPGNEITSIEQKRGAERFETLRKNALAFEEKSGEPLKTFLVNLGELRDYKPRADFVTGFFQTGGFKVISENGSLHAQEAVEKAMKAKAPFVVLCGKEEDYSTMAPEIIEGIKKTDPTVTVMIAGKTPDSLHTILMEKGLDGTVSLGRTPMNF
nr:methylmalonyl-CoA mutase family protein [Thalassobacillus sp. C254]